MDDSSQRKRWIVKRSSGDVIGPYSTDVVLQKIEKGDFDGTEQISLFPATNWFPISSATEFYDQLLKSLESKEGSDTPVGHRESSFSVAENTITPVEVEHRSRGPSSAKVERGSSTKEKIKDDPKRKKDIDPPKPEPEDSEIIELKSSKKILKKAKAKRTSSSLILLLVVAAAAAYILMPDDGGPKNSVRLLVPRSGQPAASPEQIKQFTQSAVSHFVLNDFDNLLSAQNALIRLTEGDPKKPDAFALLCLAHLEIWPFSHQDSQDLNSLSKVSQMASKLDPAGVQGSTCRVVDLLIRGRTDEAMSLVDSILETFGATENPPIVFYYFKALILKIRKDYGSAINYAQAAEPLWPNWLAPKVLLGELGLKANQTDLSVKNLNAVLKTNPKHFKAQALLGIIEMNQLKNFTRGQGFLDSALAQSEKIQPEVASDAFQALAEYSLGRGETARALQLAKEAYSKNTANQRARALVVQLGGEKGLKETKLVDRQLVYEADQLVREGDCASAQALYKTAFEANSKNAIAAMKAAECLWRMGLATEAIDWLNRSVASDPKLIDAYVSLSDFYSQRFLFQAAARVLATANSVDSRNYKVYRGLARLELRRRNGQGAVQYATQAVSLYEADVESYVILAEAQMLLNDYNEAIVASRKAREIDFNNRQAQVVYATSLFGSQGATVAIDYLSRLVTNYPMTTEYRLALGDLYLKDQNFANAKQLFEQVVRMEDKPKVALLRLGSVEQKEKRYEDALTAYIKAAALDPSDPEPLFLAGQLYLEIKKPLEAKNQFQRILNINKEYPLVNYNMGKAFLMMGEFKDALEQAKIEVQKNPRLADPYILAAEAYDLQQQYNLCASEYQKAVKLRPQGSMMYVKMARCYRLSGNLEASVSMINIANTQESGNPEVWKEQALVFETRGDKIRAIEAYNQYLVLAPNAADAESVRNRIQSLER